MSYFCYLKFIRIFYTETQISSILRHLYKEIAVGFKKKMGGGWNYKLSPQNQQFNAVFLLILYVNLLAFLN